MTYKHKLLGVVALSLLPLALSAQSASEAFRLGSATDPTGSARYTALSGAMGAVGSDASSLVRNPAGISLYRGDNRLSLTLGVAQSNTRNSWQLYKDGGEVACTLRGVLLPERNQ